MIVDQHLGTPKSTALQISFICKFTYLDEDVDADIDAVVGGEGLGDAPEHLDFLLRSQQRLYPIGVLDLIRAVRLVVGGGRGGRGRVLEAAEEGLVAVLEADEGVVERALEAHGIELGLVDGGKGSVRGDEAAAARAVGGLGADDELDGLLEAADGGAAAVGGGSDGGAEAVDEVQVREEGGGVGGEEEAAVEGVDEGEGAEEGEGGGEGAVDAGVEGAGGDGEGAEGSGGGAGGGEEGPAAEGKEAGARGGEPRGLVGGRAEHGEDCRARGHECRDLLLLLRR